MLRLPLIGCFPSLPSFSRVKPHQDWTRWTVGLAIGLLVTPALATDNLSGGIKTDLEKTVDLSVTAAADNQMVMLPDHIRRALFMDPDVSAASARVCQALHQLGLSRAQARPQLSATITGSRQIASRIKKNPPVLREGTINLGGGRTATLPGNTPAEKEIQRSGAHHRQFEHGQRNNIYDGKVSLRINLYDWGQSRANIEGRNISHDITRLEAVQTLEERSAALLNLALRLQMLDSVLAGQTITAAAVAVQVAAVQSRVDAGVGRISELREARLLQLDLEIETNRVMAQRDQLIETLKSDFDLTPDDARILYQTYLKSRPEDLAYAHAEETQKAHVLRLRGRVIGREEVVIKASRYPKLDGVMDGTVFDMTDYEDEYELVGKLEMTMPLYDGGAAKARLRETAWRSREIKSALDSLYRDHNTEMEQVTRRFNDLAREELELEARLDELHKRLESIEAVQGKTAVSPQQLAQLHLNIGQARIRLVETQFGREAARSAALTLTENLNDVLKIRIGDEGC